MILFSFLLFGCTFAAFNDTCNAPEVANYCEGICQTAFTDCALQCAQEFGFLKKNIFKFEIFFFLNFMTVK